MNVVSAETQIETALGEATIGGRVTFDLCGYADPSDPRRSPDSIWVEDIYVARNGRRRYVYGSDRIVEAIVAEAKMVTEQPPD